MERSLTIYLKGIAIILMVMHHSFAFPEWYVDGISFPYLIPYVKYINRFAGFAVVPMFLFLTGWTYYKHKDKSLIYSLSKIKTFLFDYWIVLFCFCVLAYYTCNYELTVHEIIKEMFAISNNIMIFSWFVFLYIEVMLFLPFLDKYTKNHSTVKTICFIICFFILIKILAIFLKSIGFKETFIYIAINNYIFRRMPIVISGYLCAKYNILEKLTMYFNKITNTKKLFVIAMCILLYNFITSIGTINIGFFLCPIFVALLSSLNITYDTIINKIILILGKNSMNIWFLHCLFFAAATRDMYQKYAFWSDNPLIVLIWILCICTCISIPLTKIQQFINKYLSKLL